MRTEAALRRSLLGWLTVCALLPACSTRTTNLASSAFGEDTGLEPDAASPSDADGADAGDRDGSGPGADSGPDDSYDDAGAERCGGRLCQCSDGQDNDGDGLIDGFDPECTGAIDDFEDSFATGLQGEDQEPKCQDCFFDRNSGQGNDGCNRPSSCALNGGDPGNSGACSSCEVEATCRDRCQPLVPNGCDCFGCCEIWQAGEPIYVSLRSTCSLAELGDAQKCPPCTPAPDCRNECGPCELCPGRSQLPPECGQNGPGYVCDDASPCSDASDCGANQYCQLGCCLTRVIVI